MSEEVPPEAVVRAFIAAMNRWEIDSWNAMRAVRDSADPESYADASRRALGEMNVKHEVSGRWEKATL